MEQLALFDVTFSAPLEEESYMTPAEVRTIREKLNYSQHQIAVLLDCPRERVALYETGKAKVTLRHAEILDACEKVADFGQLPIEDPEEDWKAALGYLLMSASQLERKRY